MILFLTIATTSNTITYLVGANNLIFPLLVVHDMDEAFRFTGGSPVDAGETTSRAP
jgi:hypothetical protein